MKRITSQDNYELLKDIVGMLKESENKWDDRFQVLETRVSTLEGFKAQVLIIISAAVIIATLIKDWVIAKISGKVAV